MLMSILLLFLSFCIIVFLIFFNKDVSIPITPQFSPIIFTDQTDFSAIDGLTKDNVEKNISNQIDNTKVKIGGIDGIYLTENNKTLSFRDFINFIKASFPTDKISLVNDNFLIGITNLPLKTNSVVQSADTQAIQSKKGLFILIKVRSFSDIFSPMRVWENKMLYDLHGFFNVEITPSTNYLFTKNFEDKIIENKNARILYDNNDKIVLMYVFVDDTSIVITDSIDTTNEVMLRLASSQIKK